MATNKLTEIYNILVETFGPQHWWPGDTTFEIIIGAILTQNTSWSNVAKAIDSIKKAGLMSAEKLYRLDNSQLEPLIKAAGYFRLKSKRLKNFLNWFFDNYQGNFENIQRVSTDYLREQLLSINGIGPETADSILLYGFGRARFVVDTYTSRIMARHGLIEPGADYNSLQYLFEANLPSDVKTFNEFHALLVCIGKDFCKPKAKCDKCPLRHLPHDIEPEYF
ncbi:MAG TPA: endonuclease III domain-containing protein [Sedimentisphaerales bacterium]|nr:endonuclease III domain-containing protein [Sedimentisphaerales bacterium]